MRYITGIKGLGSELCSATHYITGLVVLGVEFARIYARMVPHLHAWCLLVFLEEDM